MFEIGGTDCKSAPAGGMRDIIVHHYFDIDAEVIYKTLREDIPELLKTLITIQQDLS